MYNTSATLPGTAADDSSIGTSVWGNPDNIKIDDGNYASANLASAGVQSHFIKATNFGFAIPSDKIIKGVVVEVQWYATFASRIYDYAAKLVKGGTIGGSDRGYGGSNILPTSDGIATYGSSSDLWGNTLAPSDINDSGFGFVVNVQNTGANCSAYIDYIKITVYYDDAPANSANFFQIL